MPRHRRLAIVASASLLAGGCVSRSHPHLATTTNVTLAVGAALTAAAVVSSDSLESGRDDGGGSLAVSGVALLIIGTVVGTITAVATLVSPMPPPEAPPPPPPPSPPVALPPLPALATDAGTLALARQARMAALHGQCTAARVDLDAIAHRDAAYHDALAAQREFAPCR